MTQALIAFFAICIFLGWGYSDGYFKRKYTVKHLVKWPVYISIIGLALISVNWLAVIGIVMMSKPLFDIGYSKGVGSNGLVIGTTELTDILLRKTFMYKWEFVSKKFPFLTILYFFLIILGILVILESRFY